MGECSSPKKFTKIAVSIDEEREAIFLGFFNPGDILVLDNAAYHCGGENSVLEDWRWSRHRIFLLLLPPRCMS